MKITDRTPFENNKEARELKAEGFEVVCGEHPIEWLEEGTVVVKNPGVPYQIPFLQEALKRNIPVYTEIEVADRYRTSPLIGITGTNGKTTTTTLIHLLLEKAGKNPHLAGNIGFPLSDVVPFAKKMEPIVCELSSFQLMGTENFSPDVAVMLNITPAHLDYHSSFEEYLEAKSKIALGQSSNQLFVFNHEDKHLLALSKRVQSSLVPFSVTSYLDNGICVENGVILYKGEAILPLEAVALKGKHNLENILASIAVAKHYGVSTEDIQEVLKEFTGVKHRFQLVDNVEGVLYYNDSKATNPLASTKALQVFEKPIHWLCGGLDRGNGFNELIPYVKHVKNIYTYGETKQKIAETFSQHVENVFTFETLKEALNHASANAKQDEVVLLSPACASWDQFTSFEIRGDVFIEQVKILKRQVNRR